MLQLLRDDYMGEVHISFGMTTKTEEEEIVSFFEEEGQANRLVVYSCTSGYPVPFEDICMLEIIRIVYYLRYCYIAVLYPKTLSFHFPETSPKTMFLRKSIRETPLFRVPGPRISLDPYTRRKPYGRHGVPLNY